MTADSLTSNSRSAIYRGDVRHRRFTPVKHEFNYRLSMLLLDLDCIEEELNLPPLLGSRRPALGWFRRKDYIGDPETRLKSYVLEQVRLQIGRELKGKVLLLTHLRYWGFVMNPISIFYCYDERDQLSALALQVTNTPWREKILYVVDVGEKQRTHLARFNKDMHVSPFNPMDMQYLCRFKDAGDILFFHLENHAGGTKHTDATMVFKRYPLSRSALIRLTLRQPAMTVKVGFGIYWQALRLWLKKTPLYDHPGRHQSNSSPNHRLSKSFD